MFNKIINNIEPSATIAVSSKAKELQSQGKNIVDLSVGELDFQTPLHIAQAAVGAISRGYTKYTPVDGVMELKDAVANKFSNELISYQRDDINIGCGAKQVISNAFMTTLDPDDEVIIQAPYWPSYIQMVKIFGGKPIVIPPLIKKGRFLLDHQKISASISKKTKWFILNSPNNPSSQVTSLDEIKALCSVLAQHKHVNILIDEIYKQLYLEDLPCVLKQQPELANRALIVSGVSKAYSMTGWRVGFGISKIPGLIKNIAKIQSQTTHHTCSIAQYAAIGALNGDHAFLEKWNQSLIDRKSFVLESLKATKLKFYQSEASFYLLADHSAYETEDQKFALELLEKFGVATVPGTAFGLPGTIRISCAKSLSELEIAVEKIKKFLN